MFEIPFVHGHDKAVAIIDVSPGEASVAICAAGKNGGTEVRSTGHSALSLEARSAEQAVQQIGTQIQEAGQEAQRGYTGAGNPPVGSLYLVAHAPWVQSRVVRAHAKYEHEERIHASSIAAVAKDGLAKEKLDRAKLIEGGVMRVELNGYLTGNPEGQYADEIEVVSLITECEPSVRSAVHNAAGVLFPGVRPEWRSSVRAITMFAGASGSLNHHYCAIDMGVESSHVLSVHGAVIEQRIVPEGVRSILSRIGGGKQPEEILSSLRMLERESASTESAETLQKAVAQSEQELVKTFAEVIGSIAAVERVANNLLLVTHPDLEPWLSRFFSRIDFAQFTITTLPFAVHTPRSLMPGQASDKRAANTLLVDAALFNTQPQGEE